jgi:hypothetical protein
MTPPNRTLSHETADVAAQKKTWKIFAQQA